MTTESPAPTPVRVPELTACALALLAVVDTWLELWLAPVFWAAILLLGALALTALRARSPRADAPAWVAHHAAIGMLVIAVLLVASVPTGADPVVTPSAHAHGPAAPDAVTVVASIAAIGFAVLTVFALPRVRGWRGRMPLLAMAAVVLLMAGSVVG